MSVTGKLIKIDIANVHNPNNNNSYPCISEIKVLSGATNLAQGKTVTVSSYYSGYTGAGAVNGTVITSTAGIAGGNSWVGNNACPAWLQIDLGVSASFDTIELTTIMGDVVYIGCGALKDYTITLDGVIIFTATDRDNPGNGLSRTDVFNAASIFYLYRKANGDLYSHNGTDWQIIGNGEPTDVQFIQQGMSDEANNAQLTSLLVGAQIELLKYVAAAASVNMTAMIKTSTYAYSTLDFASNYITAIEVI